MKKKIKTFFKRNINTFLFIILIYFPIYLNLEYKLINLNLVSEIKIIIKGEGNANILFEYFEDKPDIVIINDNNEGIKNKMKYNLKSQNNIIIMKWNNSLKNCSKMFYQLSNIISFDFSNFDSSKVTNMEFMFCGCISLTSLDLSNFDTSKVNNMQGLFSGCESLQTLIFKNYNTSSVTNMQSMFLGCSSLSFLNLNSYDTSLVTNLNYMFMDCVSLTNLDLNNFDTSNVQSMISMFNGCSSLKYYCINEIKAKEILKEFPQNSINNCSYFINSENKKDSQDDEYINKCKNNDSYKFEYNNACYNSCPKRTHISLNISNLCEDLNCENYYNFNQDECITEIPKGFYLNDSILKTIDKCHNDCQTCDKKNATNNTNCNSCKDNSKYLYFGNCVSHCPNDYYNDSFNNKICITKCRNYSYESVLNDLCISCNNEYHYYPKYNENSNKEKFINCYNNPEGFFLKDKNYYQCYKTCKYCFGFGNETYNNCSECKINYTFNIFENDHNCYEQCKYNYFFDYLNKYRCTSDYNCPHNFSKLISEKRKCIDNCSNDDIYKYEFNNICFKSNEINLTKLESDIYLNINNSIDYFNNKYKINISNNNISNKDNIINNIKNDITNGSLNSLISNIIEGEKKDLIIKDDNINYQITSSYNQNNNKYTNSSTLILGECEDILKREYKIKNNQTLIIFKIDYFQPYSLIPIIGYEIYHPVSKKKLDLSPCKDIFVNYNIPAYIDEENLFKYDPENEYYTDECYPSTSDSGTDILINDRHNEFNNNNMSLCENNCTFTRYDNETKKVNCECGIKSKQLVISEFINKTDILSYNFINKKETSNMITMKCYYTLFTKNGLIKNIGSYILLFTILLFLISLILFYKCGYPLLENDIREIMNSKEKNNYNLENINETINTNEKDKKKNEKSIPKTIKRRKKKNKTKHIYNEGSKIKINNRDNRKPFKTLNLKDNTKENNEKVYIRKSNTKIQKNLSKKFNNSIKYNDFELNSLSYQEAIKYDKRTFFKYYISLIRTKQPLIFSFCPIKDYNSMIIKIDLFFLSFSIYCFFNTLFFDEQTIHKIYEEKGIYNFVYLVPHILYSFLISHTVFTIIKYFSLSERNLYEIKQEKSLDLADEIISKVKKSLIIKYICFYCLSILFLLFFWYYLSSYCSVYRNSQIYLIKNILISFSFSLAYPFIINLISAIFRSYSLNDNKRKCNYKISKIIQFI